MRKLFKVSNFDNKTLTWWWNKKFKIDMNPPYQRRGGLWSDTDKAYLIDSIINGYDIPKLYIADFTWGDSSLNGKKLPYAIIDGKQRLEAIFDFFEGTIVLNKDFIYYQNTNLRLGGLGYKDLVSNYKEIADEFENYNLTVMSVIAHSEEPINELFLRLNRSKPLTGAEIRNAMTGPTPQVIRKIANHDFFNNNIKFSIQRSEHLNVAAKFLLFEYSKNFKETTKAKLDLFVQETKSSNKEKLELAGRYVVDVLEVMSTIFLPKDSLLNSSGILPVYYWFIKNIKSQDYMVAREFLVAFEEERRKNREYIKNDPENPKIKLFFVEYDNFNRSTNNLLSHKERYNILNITFKYWKGLNTFPQNLK